MKIKGAVMEEQGVKFAVVKVSKDVFDVPGRARDRMVAFQNLFPDMAIVFVGEEPGKSPSFYGRPDIVKLIMEIPPDLIEWREFSFDEPDLEK